jgi:glycosyltransferase involved in cell wall biosynthesis
MGTSAEPRQETPVHLPRVAYVLRSFPRLSQTFVLRELLALEAIGLQLVVVAITDPSEPFAQDEVARLDAPVVYLDRPAGWGAAVRDHLEVLVRRPFRYLGALARVARGRQIDQGYVAASRMHCFRQGVRLARLLLGGRIGRVEHLHAHFAHDPAFVAMLAGGLTGTPFSFTAHARDIYQVAPGVIAARIEAAAAVVTICQANVDYLTRVAPAQSTKLHLIYNGIDLDAYPGGHAPASNAVPLIVSVGRIVEKKGFGDLLAALSLVEQSGRPFTCEIYGDGPLQEELGAAVQRLGLGAHVTLAGSQTQAAIRRALARADIFAITPFVTDDGDRDGIPTVILEAMASRVPVVSTRVVGVGEAVADGRTGLLCEPRDIAAIAANLSRLLDDPAVRDRMGTAGRQAIVSSFDISRSAGKLVELYRGIPRAASTPRAYGAGVPPGAARGPTSGRP